MVTPHLLPPVILEIRNRPWVLKFCSNAKKLALINIVISSGTSSSYVEVCSKFEALSHQSVDFLPPKVVNPSGLNKGDMKKQILKKSDVLREGYVKGLKKAQRIIKEMIE